MKNKKIFEQLTDYDIGKLEAVEWLQRQFQKEISEIRHFKVEEMLKWNTEQIMLAQLKLKIFEHYLKQIEKIAQEILEEE